MVMEMTSWKIVKLTDVAKVQTGISKSASRKLKNPVEHPYLRVANVQDGFFNLEEIKNISIELEKVERYTLQSGDVLLTEGGDFDKLGRGAVWKGQIKNCLHQNHVFAVRPNRDLLLSEYLSLLTSSDYGKKYFVSCSKQSTNLASINSTQLKAFPVLLPDLTSQKEIVSKVSIWDKAIEKSEALITAKEHQISWLTKKLINKAGFQKIPLYEVTSEVSKRNKNNGIERVLSVTNHTGFVLPEDQFERRVASSNVSNYKVVERGQYAYNPSRINVGSIARLDKWDDGILSPMYTVFKLNESIIHSDYFLHWLSSSEAKQRIKSSAQGSVRETVSFGDLRSIPISLPDLDTQLDISGILNTAKNEIDLLKRLVEKYRIQKRGLMQKMFSDQWPIKNKEVA